MWHFRRNRSLGLRNYAIAVNLKNSWKKIWFIKKILEIEDKSDDEKRITFSNLDTYMNDYRTIVDKKENRRIPTLNQFMLNDALKIIYDEGIKILDYCC